MTIKTKADKMWGKIKQNADKEIKKRKVTKSDYNKIWKKGEL